MSVPGSGCRPFAALNIPPSLSSVCSLRSPCVRLTVSVTSLLLFRILSRPRKANLNVDFLHNSDMPATPQHQTTTDIASTPSFAKLPTGSNPAVKLNTTSLVRLGAQ